MRIRSGFAWFVVLVTTTTFAQQADTAIVVGSVFDRSKAAIPGATVTLTHVATNSTTEVRSNERGEYRTPPLRLGEYEIGVKAPGFKRFTQSGVVLNIGDVRQVDATLAVGQVTDSVTVDAEPPLIHTEDATVGTVITNKQIVELPLNGRDYLQLAALSSGTAPSINGGVGISVGGMPGVQIAFLLDGQDNNNQQLNTGHSGQKEIVKPSIDAIQEFKVVTNGNSAEFGRSAAGVVSVALKSGTNQVHGAAFEFYRTAALDARNLFVDPANPNPPFGRNQYGAAVGGPLIRNKTFWFGDFEIARIRQSLNIVSTLPQAFQKAGCFPATETGKAITVIDPTTGAPFPANGSCAYYIPSTRIDSISRTLLGFYPTPQITNPASPNYLTSNYTFASPQNQDNYRWDFRVDQALGAKNTAYFRFSRQVSDAGIVTPLPPSADGSYYAAGGSYSATEVGAQTSNSTSFVLVDNYAWSPTLITSIHAGWNSLFWNNFFPSQSLTSIGIPGITARYPGFSDISISGYQDLGITNVPNQDGSQDRELTGDLTWTKGSRTIKFGVQANWLQSYFNSSQSTSGTFSFDGRFTGDPFADFLLGNVSQIGISNPVLAEQRTPLTHFFIQSDWRVTPQLTLNIGLRYELNPPSVDVNNGITNFNLATGRLVVAGPPGSDRASRSLLGVDYHQFAPRVGFAYALPDNKTAVRSSYGIFYAYTVPLRLENNPPNHVVVGLGPYSTPTTTLSAGVPTAIASPANSSAVVLTSVDARSTAPIAQQWNLNIERQLPGGILIEVGYYGNKFDHMWRSFNANQLTTPHANQVANLPYRTVTLPGVPTPVSLSTTLTRNQMDGYSNYNALQVKAEKRYSKGLTFIVSYAYSKSMALGDTSGVQNILNVPAEYAASSQDLTHHFVGSAIYDLPFGRGKEFRSHWNRVTNAFLGGWSISPIVTVDSGFPLNLSVRGNPSNTGGTDRPNINGNWQLANPTVQKWFNTSSFTKNAPLTYGTAGRNILRGPGLFNLDLALHKSFPITERISTELRLESFNVTNTPALGNPNTQVGNPNFGTISSAGPPRDNQFGVKFLF